MSEGSNRQQMEALLLGLPTFARQTTTALENGQDSIGIKLHELTAQAVSKTGTTQNIRTEYAHIKAINALAEKSSAGPFFPNLGGLIEGTECSSYLMGFANGSTLDDALRANKQRQDRASLIGVVLKKIAELHALTLSVGACSLWNKYHYCSRFHRVPERLDHRATFEKCNEGWASLNEATDKTILVRFSNAEYLIPSFATLVSSMPTYTPNRAALIHGDPHVKNILVEEASRKILFIDPRVGWDQQLETNDGLGDPLYDYANVLNSVHIMDPVFHSIENGTLKDLVSVFTPSGPNDDPVVVEFHGIDDGFELQEQIIEHVRSCWPPCYFNNELQSELNVLTANSFLGWTKPSTQIQSKEAWWAVFASMSFYLNRANQCLT